MVLPEGLEVGDEDVIDEDGADSDDLSAASGHHCHQHHDKGCVAAELAKEDLRHQGHNKTLDNDFGGKPMQCHPIVVYIFYMFNDVCDLPLIFPPW